MSYKITIFLHHYLHTYYLKIHTYLSISLTSAWFRSHSSCLSLMFSNSSIIFPLQSGTLLLSLNSFLIDSLLSNRKSLQFILSLLRMMLIFLYITDDFETNTFLKKVFTTLFEWFMPFTKKLDILCIIIFSIDIDFIRGPSRYVLVCLLTPRTLRQLTNQAVINSLTLL